MMISLSGIHVRNVLCGFAALPMMLHALTDGGAMLCSEGLPTQPNADRYAMCGRQNGAIGLSHAIKFR